MPDMGGQDGGGFGGFPGDPPGGGATGGPDGGGPDGGGWGGNALLATIPVIGPVLAAMDFSSQFQGDPTGGYSGGDGPGEPTIRRTGNNNVLQRPKQPSFQIDPNQVLNDIALGSGWGGPIQMPQMNPMGQMGGQGYSSPYGSQSGPFNWGSYLQNFGGK